MRPELQAFLDTQGFLSKHAVKLTLKGLDRTIPENETIEGVIADKKSSVALTDRMLYGIHKHRLTTIKLSALQSVSTGNGGFLAKSSTDEIFIPNALKKSGMPDIRSAEAFAALIRAKL